MTSAMSRPHRPGRAGDRDFASLCARKGWPATCSGSAAEVSMTLALRLPLVLVFFALLLASPAAFGRHSRKVAAQKPDDSGECLRLPSRGEVLAGALLSGSLGPAGQGRQPPPGALFWAQTFPGGPLRGLARR